MIALIVAGTFAVGALFGWQFHMKHDSAFGCASAPVREYTRLNDTCLNAWKQPANRCEQMWIDYAYSRQEEKPGPLVIVVNNRQYDPVQGLPGWGVRP